MAFESERVGCEGCVHGENLVLVGGGPLSNESGVKKCGRVWEVITAFEDRVCVVVNPSDARWDGVPS